MTASAALDSIRICSGCNAPGDDQWVAGYSGSGSTCSRCGRYQEDCNVFLPEANEPRLAESGRAIEFTTCLDLDHRIVWDANGYYRVLGIAPNATKREIREAYQRIEGHRSAFATYAVKQLLNDEIRTLYDSVALGDTFFDHYAAAHVRRVAAQDIAMSNMTGTSDGTPVELDLEHLMNKPFQVVDTGARSGQSAVSHPPGTTSAWGYYRWQSKATDTGRLARWRGLLAGALQEKGERRKIAVGYLGSMAQPWDLRQIGYRLVVFLNDRMEPNSAMAQAVADRVVSIIPTSKDR